MHKFFTTRIGHTILLVLFLAPVFSQKLEAQRVAVGTDVVDWLTCTPNIDIEARLSRRLTLDVSVGANPFRNYFGISKLRTSNLRIQPEVRYWFNRPMACHFVGINATACIFDLRLNKKYCKGDLLAIGARYGYSLVLSKQWNVVFSGGIGLGYVHGYKFNKQDERPKDCNLRRIIPIPDISVTFSYILK